MKPVLKFLLSLSTVVSRTLRLLFCLFFCMLAGCEECKTIDCVPYHQYSFVVTGFNIDEINSIEVRVTRKVPTL